MNLKVFCADSKTEARPYLWEPFEINGRICCSNGHVFAMGGVHPGLPEAHKSVKNSLLVGQLLEGMPETDFTTLT